MREYKYVIIGTTVSGIGVACVLGGCDVLVVDPTIICGHDFTATYKIGEVKKNPKWSHKTCELFREIQNAGLLKENRLSVCGVSGILAKMLLHSGCEVRFLTEVTEIRRKERGFCITLFSRDGFEKVFANEILDFTTYGACHDLSRELPWQVEYTALITKNSSISFNVNKISNEIILEECAFDNEYVFGVKKLANENIHDTRMRLHGIWQKLNEDILSDFCLDMTASEYRYSISKKYKKGYSVKLCENWIWHPSAVYDDLISAFEGGVTMCLKK